MYDALSALAQVDKKGGPIAIKVLESARRNGLKQGYDEQRMFVKTAIVGKALSHKKIDIRGRGKTGTIKVPKSSMTITLEERTPLDFYKMVLKGDTPPSVGEIFKRMLY